MSYQRLGAAALALGVLALIVAGCGSSSKTSSTSAGQSTAASVTNAGSSSSGAATIVSTAGTPKFGTVLVNSKGLALYDFQKDSGTKSACYGSCAKVWPPLTSAGTPKAAGGVEGSKLGTIKRTDGTTQVTYNGHPLYTYTADRGPGEVNGNGTTSFGGSWHALDPSGSEAKSAATSAGGSREEATTAPSSGGSTGSGGGGGYGY